MNLPKIDQSDPLKKYLSGMSSSSSISPMANSTSSSMKNTPIVTPSNTSATASPAFSGNLNLKTPGFAPKPAVTQTPAAQSYISSLGTKAEISPEQMKAGEAFTAQANAQPQNSTSAATPASVTAPAISQNDTRKAYIQYLTGLGKEAQKFATPSQEEQDVATQLRQQTQMERQGLEDLKGQGRGIPLSVLGRQGTKIERDSALQKLALSENLQALTAQRTAQLDAANAAVKNGQLLQFGDDYVDPSTGDVVYSKPKEGEAGFTLGEGQVRYDAQGNKIAEGAAKQEAPTKLDTSVVEAGGRKVLINNQTGETIRDLGDAKTVSPAQEAKAIADQEKNTATQQQASQSIGLVNNLLSGNRYKAISGVAQSGSIPFFGDRAAVNEYNQLKSSLALGSRSLLKGQGAVSDYEGKILDTAVSSLSRLTNEGQMKEALQKVRGVLKTNNGQTTNVTIANPDGRQVTADLSGSEIYHLVSEGATVKYN